MSDQEFQPDYYRKGQQVGQGRETMGARREEKRMNYDGQWDERVSLSRVTEVIHATPIKWERVVVRNCQEMGPPGHENGLRTITRTN